MDNEDYVMVRDGLQSIANAITPLGSLPADDGYGGYVASLTESMMSISASLRGIAEEIHDLRGAMEELDGTMREVHGLSNR